MATETTSDKLEKCEVCAVNRAKYTCPKCEVRTCGLACVNIHKKELECDGIRDKTKFVPLSSFTDLDLLSDYRLLEDIGRNVEKLQKNPLKRCTRQMQQLPLHLHKLRCAAYNRRVDLQFMPQNFSRHKENTTYLDWSTNELSWKVELIFVHADNVKWVIERVSETKRLSALLEEVFNSDIPSESSDDELPSKLSILRKKIMYYRGCGLTGVRALLKAEKVQKSDSRFYELDSSESLQENFKNKTIIEYPIIYVALKDHGEMFDIIESDDEELKTKFDRPRKNRRMNSDSRIKSTKREHSPKQDNQNVDSSNNFFFNAEVSDSEEELNSELQSHKDKFQRTDNELAIVEY